ncbi:MAG: hypothetical protein JKY85_08860 [Porticoccus sp.]|nr:hypothetical protein [Porticoccus sp.]
MIELNKVGIWNACLEQEAPKSATNETATPVEITIPIQLKRCGIETKLVNTNGPPPKAHPTSVRAIQQALLKALIWNQELLTGRVKSIMDIAKREQVNSRYISHIIKLAFLSPVIMQKIIDGKIPTELNLERFKAFNLNSCWEKQAAILRT